MANNLLNIKVLGQIIGAELPNKLQFTPLAQINSTLEKVAGDTIIRGKYAYIGEATKVAPGAAIPISDLSMTSQEVTVTKSGKGIKLTDEDVIVRGKEVINEGKAQLLKSIADKVDSDCLTALQSTTVIVDKSTAEIDYAAIVDAVGAFGDEDDTDAVLFIHPAQKAKLLKDPEFIKPTAIGDVRMMKGIIGEIAGCQVKVSKKIVEKAGKYENIVSKVGALGLELAKATVIGEDRYNKNATSEYYATHHYAAYLKDESKCVKLKTKSATVVKKA